jgi:outer membrane lipoprotein-sorting protein
MKVFKFALLLLLVTAIPAYAGKIKNGEELITAMHRKYEGKWYKTLTFVQKNTQYQPDGTTQNSVWYEAMGVPGKLRIDFDPLDQNNGMIFNDNKQHIFRNGKLATSRPLVHSLLVLGFDIYRQPAETTIKQLRDLKFDLSILRKDKWQGRDVYVVGAKEGDLKSRQFWIDKKNLYFVRTIQPAGPNGERTQEIQFNKYEKVKGGGWIAPEVLFLVDGKKNFIEEYTEMQFNVELSDDLFDPEKWTQADKSYFKIKN